MPVTQRLTDCSCLALPYAFADGRCVHGCGLSEGGPYASMVECCDDNFSGGDGSLGVDGCMAEDECPAGPLNSSKSSKGSGYGSGASRMVWPGVDRAINAVVGTKAMVETLAENVMSLALSGHVLAAGPVLWLKYGPKYAFAAVAGFLSIDIEPLFPALSLQLLSVSHAAELIYASCQSLSQVKKGLSLQTKHHELLPEGNEDGVAHL